MFTLKRCEGEKDMSSVLERQYKELKVNVERLRSHAIELDTDKDGNVVLDRDNPDHREFFGEDEE